MIEPSRCFCTFSYPRNSGSGHSLLLSDQLSSDEENNLVLRLSADGPAFSPVEIAQHILSTLLQRSELQCGVRAQRAIIGVPTHFSNAQKEATLTVSAYPIRIRLSIRQAPSLIVEEPRGDRMAD